MKKILVPTDFSACAGNAVNFAIQTARIFRGEVTFLHSLETASNRDMDWVGMNMKFKQLLLNNVRKNFTSMTGAIETNYGLKVTSVTSTDPLQEAVRGAVIDKQIDLVIMGTQGANSSKEKIRGSKTAIVIQKAGIPVLAVPQDYIWTKPQKLLLATNHFEKDQAILNLMFELADFYLANVHIIIFTKRQAKTEATLLNDRHCLSDYTEFLKDVYQGPLRVSARQIGESFEESLQIYIRENNIDILTMVTQEQSCRNRRPNPIKTKRMSYHTTIPLLALPSG